jgi:hypothetical protein
MLLIPHWSNESKLSRFTAYAYSEAHPTTTAPYAVNGRFALDRFVISDSQDDIQTADRRRLIRVPMCTLSTHSLRFAFIPVCYMYQSEFRALGGTPPGGGPPTPPALTPLGVWATGGHGRVLFPKPLVLGVTKQGLTPGGDHEGLTATTFTESNYLLGEKG